MPDAFQIYAVHITELKVLISEGDEKLAAMQSLAALEHYGTELSVPDATGI